MPHNENWPKRLRVRNDPGPKRPTKIGRNDPRPNLGRNDPGRNDPAETTQGRNVPDSILTVSANTVLLLQEDGCSILLTEDPLYTILSS